MAKGTGSEYQPDKPLHDCGIIRTPATEAPIKGIPSASNYEKIMDADTATNMEIEGHRVWLRTPLDEIGSANEGEASKYGK